MENRMANPFLNSVFNEAGINMTEEQSVMFSLYAELLIEWNNRFNLTAITEIQEIAVKHFADSLTLLGLLGKSGSSLIDIGTGAGFPGIPLGIMRQDMMFTLIDSTKKKIVFVKEVIKALNLTHVDCVHERAERAGRTKTPLKGRFDYAAARAVAPLSYLVRVCLPYLRENGVLFSMKGPNADEEIKEAEESLKRAGGEIVDVIHMSLHGGYKRAIVCVCNTTPTDW